MRQRPGDLQVEKEHLITPSIPVRLRSLEKSLAGYCAGSLVIHAKKYSIRVRYFDSDEGDFCFLKKLSHLRSNALIRLKFDGEINAPAYQVLRIL